MLDEPTNHLDLEMRAAIELALQSYQGAIVLISHDRHLLKTCVEQFYLVFKHRIHPFDGDIDDYYQWLSQDRQVLNKKSLASKEINYKELKVLQNRVKKLEQLIQASEKKIADITKELYEESLYLPENASQLSHLQHEQALLKQTIATHEAEWFQVHEHLENNND